jgi:hypothetical protein
LTFGILSVIIDLQNKKGIKKMDVVLIILGILYLCGVNVGKGLAICAIIEGILVFIKALSEKF